MRPTTNSAAVLAELLDLSELDAALDYGWHSFFDGRSKPPVGLGHELHPAWVAGWCAAAEWDRERHRT
jgi:hypothetical protein